MVHVENTTFPIEISKAGFRFSRNKLHPISGSIFRFIPSGSDYQILSVNEVAGTVKIQRMGTGFINENYDSKNLYPIHGLWLIVEAGKEGVKAPVIIQEEPLNKYVKTPVKFVKIHREFSHYTDMEKKARENESMGNLAGARAASSLARSRMARDLVLDAEEKALNEGNVISSYDLSQLGQADREMMKMKGLKHFQHYEKDFPELYWYE